MHPAQMFPVTISTWQKCSIYYSHWIDVPLAIPRSIKPWCAYSRYSDIIITSKFENYITCVYVYAFFVHFDIILTIVATNSLIVAIFPRLSVHACSFVKKNCTCTKYTQHHILCNFFCSIK